MKKDIFYTLIETVVGNKLKDMKKYPERSARNLIDLGLLFSNGKFQNSFFSSAQAMLQNEESPYYTLIDNVINNVDYNRLLTFGMNLGYNSFKCGSREIRKNERILDCIIPWNIILHIDYFSFNLNKHYYHKFISKGENLGIYSWIIFLDRPSLNFLELVRDHPNSVFFIFLDSKNLDYIKSDKSFSIDESFLNKETFFNNEHNESFLITENFSRGESFLDFVEELNNIMLVIELDKKNQFIYKELKNRQLLYSVYYKYSQKNVDLIIDRSILRFAQQFNPFFTIFISEPYCNDDIRKMVYEITEQTRKEQQFSTIAWELLYSNSYIDELISGKSRYMAFDKNGNLMDIDGKIDDSKNIFCSD